MTTNTFRPSLPAPLFIISILIFFIAGTSCAPLDGDFEEDPIFIEEEEEEENPALFEDDEEVEPTDNGSGEEGISAQFDLEESAESGLQNTFEPYFEEGDCPFAAEIQQEYSLTCGSFFVPENRLVENSNVIELAVMILPAVNENPLPDPVIYLEGGPGGSAIDGFTADPEGWVQYGFTQNRELILFDQRGTGYSLPELDCDESDERAGAEEIAEQCKEDLEAEEIDLSAYNTQENAADVADLAIGLGYETYNLLGISYGTRLGLAVMRDHPEGLRSVVLDSPFPPNVNPAEADAGIAWRRFEAVFDTCEADSACVAAYPDLEQTLLDTVDQLNEEPIDDIYGDDIVSAIYEMLFSGSDYIFLVPQLIKQASEGNLDLFFELEPELFGMAPTPPAVVLRQSIATDDETDGDASGMYNSVMCHDEFAFSDIDVADQRTQQEVPDPVYYGLFGPAINIFATCEIWDVGSAEEYVNEPVVSDIPTLVLVGEFDPATPPEWGQLTVESLSNGTLVEFPGDGHALVAANGCAIGMMDAFFENPNSFDTSCATQADPILFALDNE